MWMYGHTLCARKSGDNERIQIVAQKTLEKRYTVGDFGGAKSTGMRVIEKEKRESVRQSALECTRIIRRVV